MAAFEDAVGEVVTVFVFVWTMGIVIVNCSVTVTVGGGRDMISDGTSNWVSTSFIVGVSARPFE